MRVDSSGPGVQSVVTRRAKQGARDLWPGSYLSITVSLMKKQLVQLDRLAVEIRAAAGVWITRSGIIAAMVEASLQTSSDSDRTQTLSDDRHKTNGGGTGSLPL